MRRFYIAALILVVAISASVVTMGAVDEREDRGLNDAVDAIIEAWMSGDVDTFWEYVDPTMSGFSFRQDSLNTVSVDASQAICNAEYQVRLTERDRRLQSYGDTVVATASLDGSITLPGSVAMRGTWRMSSVWVLRDAGWRLVHYHHSRLAPDVVTDDT